MKESDRENNIIESGQQSSQTEAEGKKTRGRLLFEQVSKYLSVGGLMSLMSIFLYWLMLDIWAWPVYPVYTGVYILAVLISYFMNARFTFKEEANLNASIKYFVVYMIGFLVGYAAIYWLKESYALKDFYNVLLSIPPRVVVTFALLKLYVFKK